MIKGALVLAMGCIAGNAQVFTIDDFETAPFSQTGSSTEFATYEDQSILGGFRQVRMVHGDIAQPSVNTTVADGVLTFNETAPSALVLRYGSFADANDSTALGLDLSNPGENETYHFTIEVTSMTAPFDGYIDFYSYDTGGVGHYYDAVFFSITAPGIHAFNISEISDSNWINDSSIAGFEVQLGSGLGSDVGTYGFGAMGIQSMAPVPEPSTYAAIFAAGLLAFAAWRKFSLRNPASVSDA